MDPDEALAALEAAPPHEFLSVRPISTPAVAAVVVEPTSKACPYCAETIAAAAIFCKHCRRDLTTGLDPTAAAVRQASLRRNSGIAALLSAIIPGAGQLYCGRFTGLLWLIFVPAGYLALILPGVLLHVLCIGLAADAAYKSNKANGVD